MTHLELDVVLAAEVVQGLQVDGAADELDVGAVQPKPQGASDAVDVAAHQLGLRDGG